MKIELGYGKEKIAVDIDESRLLGVMKPYQLNVSLTGLAEVERALADPIGTVRLRDIVKKGEKIAIITSDITRPMPSYLVLPPLLEELRLGGVSLSDITVVFALGSHRIHTESEKKALVGEQVYEQVKCIDSDVHDCVDLGHTKRGTPVSIFRPVVEADRRICLGNIEFHYFAGYSGGAKAIMPGVSTREAIQCNHSMMVSETAKAGSLDENPVRQDIEDVAKFISIDFILNVVLDEQKSIIKAVAGHFQKAHQEGCRFLDDLNKVKISEKADIVIVSPGGYPKDINLYQAQKALDNAKHAVKDGGIIILTASAREGLGEHTFEEWLKNAPNPESMIERIKTDFQLGGHKAAAIALVLAKARIFFVSDLPSDFVRSIFLEPFENIEMALREAEQALGNESKILVMPYGGSTLPENQGCKIGER